MTAEVDVERELAELDEYLKSLPAHPVQEAPSEADIADMLKELDKLGTEQPKFSIPEETRLALAQIERTRDRAELRGLLSKAESLAMRADASEAASLIQKALLCVAD